MKTFIIIFTFAFFGQMAFGQSQAALEKIEAAKIALITERLELTPEQAEKFWPVYREYSEKQREIRQEFQTLKREFDPATATEDESKKVLDRGYQIKERQLELDQNYSQRMQQVVSSRQLMNLKKAEDDFKDMLMKRIRDETIQRQRMDGERLRNDQQLKQRKTN
ncbi:MAG: hypothetical protein ACJA08_000680 [Cyclobacteriaceae bacterium]|jgi:hypothetical protein